MIQIGKRKDLTLSSTFSNVSYQLFYIVLICTIYQDFHYNPNQANKPQTNNPNLNHNYKHHHRHRHQHLHLHSPDAQPKQQQQQNPEQNQQHFQTYPQQINHLLTISRTNCLINNFIDNKPYDNNNNNDNIIIEGYRSSARRTWRPFGFLGASAAQLSRVNEDSTYEINRQSQLTLQQAQQNQEDNLKLIIYENSKRTNSAEQSKINHPNNNNNNHRRRHKINENRFKRHHNHHQHRHYETRSTLNQPPSTSTFNGNILHNKNNNDNFIIERKRRQQTAIYDQSAADYTDRPLVMTNKGFVRGITQKTVSGKFVDTFLGIPYAQAPIGKYRFRHPQAIQAWQGELDASKMSNSCPQINDTFFGSNFPGTSIWNANTPIHEDCLYLNVWSPFGVANATIAAPMQTTSMNYNNNNYSTNSNNQKIPSTNNNNQQQYNHNNFANKHAPLRPVLVWIFGGGFTSGTSSLSLYEGGLMASEEDIIVVSMNYRVAALGFLYLARPDAPGNAGLFDQVMALQWISDNIDQFGGDPKRVTIFGESAGAVSASLHLLSPISRNLFQQAILQSASATAPWAIKDTREILLNGIQLATHLGCRQQQQQQPNDTIILEKSLTNGELDNILHCMLKVDANELVKYEVGQSRTILKFPFVPIVDGSFLVEPPIESLIKQNFKPARLLVGSNGDEGNYWLIYLSELHQCSSSQKVQQTAANNMQTGSNNFQNINNNNNQPEYADMLLKQRARRHLQWTYEQQPNQQQTDDAITNSDANNNYKQSQTTTSSTSSTTTTTTTTTTSTDPFKYGFCKPNEQTISRDTFYKLLQREEVNPNLKYPIAREAILFEYTNWINPNDSFASNDALDKIFGDYQFSCPVQDFALRYSSTGNEVYMYHYKHRSSISAWPKWMGVLHGDEINFIFGEPLNSAFNYTKKEVEFSKSMMRYWANFAKSG